MPRQSATWLSPFAFFAPVDPAARSSPWPGCVASAQSPQQPRDGRCCFRFTAGSKQTSTHRSGRPATRLVVRESSIELMIERSLPSLSRRLVAAGFGA